MAFQSKRQRQAVMAKRAQQGGGQVRVPYSRRTDLALGAAGVASGALLTPMLAGRAVRRFGSEQQYTVEERMARRGTAGQRVSDVAKQAGGYLAPSLGVRGAARLVGLRPGLGRGALAIGAGVAGFAATRKHVNRLRNERLVKAGGTVKPRKRK